MPPQCPGVVHQSNQPIEGHAGTEVWRGYLQSSLTRRGKLAQPRKPTGFLRVPYKETTRLGACTIASSSNPGVFNVHSVVWLRLLCCLFGYTANKMTYLLYFVLAQG